MSPIPIIVIGRSARIATKVCEDLLPEYDVIHVVLSVEQAVKDLPILLSAPPRIPDDSRDNIGSQRYDARPRAVAVGGGIDDEMFNEVMHACKDAKKGIVWVRADISKDDMPSISDTDAFGAETAKRVKRKLHELGVGGEEGVKNQGVHFFSSI